MKKILHFAFKQLVIVCLLVSFNSQSLFAQNCPTKPNIQGPPAVCPGAVNIPYVVKDSSATAWKWEIVEPNTAFVSADYLDMVGIGDSIEIDWKDMTHVGRTTTIRLISSYPNCPNDTTDYLVKISNILQTPIPSGPTEICVDANNVIEYSVPLIPHTKYDWYISGTTTRFEPFGSFPSGNVAKVVFRLGIQNGAIIDRIGVRATYTNPNNASLVCPDDQVRYIEVKVKPQVDLSVPKTPVIVCSGDTMELSLPRPLAQEISKYKFSWTKPKGWIDTLTNPAEPLITISSKDLDTVVYKVTLTKINDGCTKSDSVMVLVKPKPLIEVTGNNIVCKDFPFDNTYSLNYTYAAVPNWLIMPSDAGVGTKSNSGKTFSVNWDSSFAKQKPYIQYSVLTQGDTLSTCKEVIGKIPIQFRKFQTNKPFGDSVLCITNPEGIYSVKSNGGGKVYEWFAGETSSSYASIEPLHKDGSNDSIKVKWIVREDLNGEPIGGPWWITVRQFGTEDDECFNDDLDTLFIQVMPEQDCDKIGVGVDKPYEILQNVSLSPNPFNSNIELRLDIKKSEKLELEVLDLTGRKVYSENVVAPAGSYSTNLNLSDLPPGIYMLSISSNNYSKRHLKSIVKY